MCKGTFVFTLPPLLPDFTLFLALVLDAFSDLLSLYADTSLHLAHTNRSHPLDHFWDHQLRQIGVAEVGLGSAPQKEKYTAPYVRIQPLIDEDNDEVVRPSNLTIIDAH